MIVIGHKNPDTDSIVASIAYTQFCNLIGKQAKAYRIGEINPETEFVLQKFGFSIPPMLSEITDSVALVDHNSLEESAPGLDETRIVEVIDHHKLSLITSNPIFVHIEPIGSTSSIIFKFFKQKNLKIDQKLAGALLAAILSDTVIFKSPTTTEEDKAIANELAKLANIPDIISFGVEVKKKKADFSKTPASEIIKSEAKEYVFGTKKFIVAQVEVFDWELKKRKNEIVEEMKKQKGFDAYLFMLTNIMTEETLLLYVGDESIIKKAFPFGSFEENAILLEKTLSRKKQIIPPLQKACS